MAMLAAAGCSNDPSAGEPPIGQVERTVTMTAANLALVTAGEGTATLVGRLINDAESADRLVDVEVDSEEGPREVTMVGDPIVVTPTDPVELGTPARVLVDVEGIQPGLRVELTLTFEEAAPISATVPLESQTGPYADVEVPPAA
jgi:hypothetical protein